MSKHYVFDQITVAKAPGFSYAKFPKIESISDNLVLVHGPNGVGKSTLMKALHSLLFDSGDFSVFVADALLSEAKNTWKLERNFKQLIQTRMVDNQVTTLGGRNDEYSKMYWFGLEDFLGEQLQNSVFSNYVEQQVQGGIDLVRAMNEAGGKTSFSTSNIKESKEYKNANENVQNIRKNIIGNKHIKEQLDDLKKEISQSSALKTKKQFLEYLQDYLETQKKASDSRTNLASYDERMEFIAKNDFETAQRLLNSVNDAEILFSDEESALNDCLEELASKSIEKSLLDNPNKTKELQNLIHDLLESERDLVLAKTELTKEETKLKLWQSEHTWISLDAPDLVTLQKAVSKLQNIASEYEPLRDEVATRKFLYDWFKAKSSFDSEKLRNLETLQTRLISILDKAKPETKTKFTSLWILIGGSFLALISAAIGGSFGAFIGLLLLVLSSILSIDKHKKSTKSERSSAFGEAISQYEELAKDFETYQLKDWGYQSITEMLTRVSKDVAAEKEQEQLSKELQRFKNAYEGAVQAYEQWMIEREGLSSSLNLSKNPVLSGSPFFNVASHLLEWINLKASTASVREKVDHLEKTVSDTISTIQKASLCDIADPQKLRVEVELLIDTIKDVHDLQAKQNDVTRRVNSAKESLTAKTQDVTAFFSARSLDATELDTLKKLASDAEVYQQTKQELKIAENELSAFSENVKQAASVTTLDVVAKEISDLEVQIGLLEAKNQDYGSLSNQYKALTNNEELAQAELALSKSSEHLDARRRDEVSAKLIYHLYEMVKEQTEKTFQPQVMKIASQWFLRITQNRYSLGYGDDGFFAYDEIQKANFTLAQLSGGSKVQLLFALRMAFVELLEASHDHHFPLFFDELMANSDDERSLAIASAIAEIAKDRQVFYSTAQADEVDKLKSIAPSLHLIDLEDEQRSYRKQERIFKVVESSEQKIVPFEQDYTKYATLLEVDSPDLFDSIGDLHSWYLCTDSEELKNLLDRNFIRSGQAKQVNDVLQARFELLEEAQQLAQSGRCKHLTVGNLGSDDLSINRTTGYYKALYAAVAENDINGNELLDMIAEGKIPRIKENVVDDLRQFLESHSFATSLKPLDEEAILTKIQINHPDLLATSIDMSIVVRYLRTILV